MATVFNTPYEDQKDHPAIRVAAKTYMFARLYGGREQTIQGRLEIAALDYPELDIQVPKLPTIRRNLRLLEESYGGFFNEYVPAALHLAREQGGWTHTAFGRPCKVDGLFDRDKGEREAAERQVISRNVQGTAGDAVRIAMLTVSRIKHGRLLLQVHDELVSSLDEGYEEAYKTNMIREMELGQPFEGVPLVVDAIIGKNWRECHK